LQIWRIFLDVKIKIHLQRNFELPNPRNYDIEMINHFQHKFED